MKKAKEECNHRCHYYGYYCYYDSRSECICAYKYANLHFIFNFSILFVIFIRRLVNSRPLRTISNTKKKRRSEQNVAKWKPE